MNPMNRDNLVDEYSVEPFTIQIFDDHSIKSFEKEYVSSYGQEKSRNVILFEKIKMAMPLTPEFCLKSEGRMEVLPARPHPSGKNPLTLSNVERVFEHPTPL